MGVPTGFHAPRDLGENHPDLPAGHGEGLSLQFGELQVAREPIALGLSRTIWLVGGSDVMGTSGHLLLHGGFGGGVRLQPVVGNRLAS